jgi:DNA-binding GntR family transcriptional regulator
MTIQHSDLSYGPNAVNRLSELIDPSILAGVPWSLCEAFIPARLAPPHWDGCSTLSMALVERGLPVERHERAFSARLADEEDARWVEMERGEPVLAVLGVNADPDGHAVIEVGQHTRGDRAEYMVRLPQTTTTAKEHAER